MQVALFGNPNTGKTSLFNVMTGSYEFIGNWNGVTVEKKVGRLKNHSGSLVDLPGIYTLTPLSKDEAVASAFLLENTFTSILNIIDASQLARNLHLTIELLEFGKPAVIGLNMIDVTKHRGLDIDADKLAERLGVQVIPIVARTGRGCRTMTETFSANLATERPPQTKAEIISFLSAYLRFSPDLSGLPFLSAIF